MKELEQDHAELHSTIRRVVQMKNAGDADGAEREYAKVGPISDKVMGLLNEVEKQVGG